MVHLIAPDDFDPDDALESRWLRDHDGAPALEEPHPEGQARECLMAVSGWLPVRFAGEFFAYQLRKIERRGSDANPY